MTTGLQKLQALLDADASRQTPSGPTRRELDPRLHQYQVDAVRHLWSNPRAGLFLAVFPCELRGKLAPMGGKARKCYRCGGTDMAPSGNCRPCRKADVREWKRKNPEIVKKQNREYAIRIRREAMEIIGLVCACPGCLVDRYVFLALDHINGGGHQERKAGSNPASRYNWIRRHPEEARLKFQTLCHNCNWAKFVDPAHSCEER